MAIAEHTDRATRLIAKGDYREAVRTCRRALLAHPESILIRMLLGRGLLAMERYEEVRTEMRAVLRSSPREARAFRFLGEAYLYDGRPDRAIEAFHAALEIDPSYEEVQSLLDDAAMDEPTATLERELPSAAEITRESLLPGFSDNEEGTEPTQRALPKALFRQRQQARERKEGAERSQSSLPSPARLPSGIAGIAPAAPSASPKPSGQESAPPPPPPRAYNRPLARPPSANGSTVPPPPPKQGDAPVFSKTLLGSPAPGNDPSLGPLLNAPLHNAPQHNDSLQDFDTAGGDTKDTWNTADGLLSGELDAMEQELRHRPDTSDFDELPTAVQDPPTMIDHENPAPLVSEPTMAEDLSELESFVDRDTNDPDPLWKSPSYAPVPPPSAPPPTQGPRVRRGSPHISQKQRWLLGGVALLLLFGLGFGITAWWRIHSRAEDTVDALDAVTRHGGRSNYERAMGLLERQENEATQARLLGAHAYEYGGLAVEELLKATQGLEASDANHGIAVAYAALLAGDPVEALSHVQPLLSNAEAQYVASLAYMETGQWDDARKSARSAAQLLPGASRYEAQRVFTETVTGVAGNPPTAQTEHPGLQTAALVQNYFRGSRNQEDAIKPLLEADLSIANQGWLRWLMMRLQIDKNNSEAAQKMAESLTSEQARSALVQAPSALRLLIATALLDLNQPEEAKVMFETLSDGVRARTEALSPQVHQLLLEGRAKTARELLARFKTQSPQLALLRAKVELEDAKPKEALTFLASPMEETATRVEAMTLAGRAHASLGEWKRAIERLEPVWKLKKNHATITRELVRSLIAVGETKRAEDIMTAFESAGGDASAIAGSRVRMALDAGKLEEAKTAALAIRSSDSASLALKAQVLRRVGELQNAKKIVELAKGDDLKSQELVRETVLLALRQNLFEDAKQAARALSKTDPRSLRIRAMVDIIDAGGASALEQIGDLSEINDADQHVYRGYGLYHAERDREARSAFNRALSLSAKHPEAYVGLALLALRAGSYGRAATQLASAKSAGQAQGLAKPFTARLLAIEAKLNYERGGFAQASTLVKRALDHDKGCSLAHQVAASLDEERGRDATAEFKRAVAGTFVMPEALARYALASSADRCALAARYLKAAPKGYDAADMRKMARRCK